MSIIPIPIACNALVFSEFAQVNIYTTHPQHIRLLFAYGWGTCINVADALDWQDLLRLQGISKT